jgi:hypothetical protein
VFLERLCFSISMSPILMRPTSLQLNWSRIRHRGRQKTTRKPKAAIKPMRGQTTVINLTHLIIFIPPITPASQTILEECKTADRVACEFLDDPAISMEDCSDLTSKTKILFGEGRQRILPHEDVCSDRSSRLQLYRENLWFENVGIMPDSPSPHLRRDRCAPFSA